LTYLKETNRQGQFLALIGSCQPCDALIHWEISHHDRQSEMLTFLFLNEYKLIDRVPLSATCGGILLLL
jgi:hypothetical protein